MHKRGLLLALVVLLLGVTGATMAWMNFRGAPANFAGAMPELVAQPKVVSDDLREILDLDGVEMLSTPTTSGNTTTTQPPAPQGDTEEKIECSMPVTLTLHLAEWDLAISAGIDVSDTRFYPAKNRVDIHVSSVNGLPCADTDLPVKLLGHKQHQFCNLVVEDDAFDPCEYGVSLGDQVLVILEDGATVVYEVVEPLESDIATPLVEVYEEYYTEAGINPTPATMFRKFTEYVEYYDEIFSREDASDELWIFTSCGNDIDESGNSQDACAVRTEFRHLITPEERLKEAGAG